MGRDEASQRGLGRWTPCRLATRAAVDPGVCDEDASEGTQYRVSAGAPQSRRVQGGRLVGVTEAVGGTVGQQNPRGSEIESRIAGEEVTEVNHAADRTIRGEDVGRMQIAVQPQRRASPIGRGDGVFPDRADGIGDQPEFGGRCQLLGEPV